MLYLTRGLGESVMIFPSSGRNIRVMVSAIKAWREKDGQLAIEFELGFEAELDVKILREELVVPQSSGL